jgi:hypothetical protein
VRIFHKIWSVKADTLFCNFYPKKRYTILILTGAFAGPHRRSGNRADLAQDPQANAAAKFNRIF